MQPIHPRSAEYWSRRTRSKDKESLPAPVVHGTATRRVGRPVRSGLIGGTVSAGYSYALSIVGRIPQRCRHSGRALSNWRSGEVSIPARCRAANFQNPLPSRRRPLPIVNGVPSEIRTPYLPRRRRTLSSNELRERDFWSAPGESNPAVYGDLPLRAYKAQPHPVLARWIGQGGVIRTRGLMHPRHALWPG